MKNEDFDYPISRSFFPERLWHRAEPRRASRSDRAAKEVAQLRRQRDEWCAEAILLRGRVAELESRLAAMTRSTGRKPVSGYSGIVELRST